MDAEPLTWHYGLMALWWSLREGGEDIEYYRRCIERYGQPALDISCGTGRLLVPMLKAGIDIDGVDISEDMLDYCRQKASQEGYSPNLSAQPMHQLSLPRKYKTIYICDSFGLGGSRAKDQATLQRVYDLLEPGGHLVFNLDVEYSELEGWNYWVWEEQAKLPEPWPEKARIRPIGDGSELEMKIRLYSLNAIEQSVILQMHIAHKRGGEVISEEQSDLRSNMYFKNEMILMLEKAGFQVLPVKGEYTAEDANSRHKNLTFDAQKL